MIWNKKIKDLICVYVFFIIILVLLFYMFWNYETCKETDGSLGIEPAETNIFHRSNVPHVCGTGTDVIISTNNQLSVDNCDFVLIISEIQDRYFYMNDIYMGELNKTLVGQMYVIGGGSYSVGAEEGKNNKLVFPGTTISTCDYDKVDEGYTCFRYTDSTKVNCGTYRINKEGKII